MENFKSGLRANQLLAFKKCNYTLRVHYKGIGPKRIRDISFVTKEISVTLMFLEVW
jgi:hypothetical protein